MRTIFWEQRIVRTITIFTKIFILYCTCNGLKKLVSNFSGFVQRTKINDYTQNREKFVKKGRGEAFREAVKRIDEFISNPIVCIKSYTTNCFLFDDLKRFSKF